MMPNCKVVRSTKVNLNPSLKWDLNLDFNGYRPFENIELEDKIIAGAEVSRCENYGDYEDAIVIVFELKKRY